MNGLKIQQLKDAMKTILKDMKSGDQFNIVTFSTDVTEWKRDFVPATTENIIDASVYSDKIVADGCKSKSIQDVERRTPPPRLWWRKATGKTRTKTRKTSEKLFKLIIMQLKQVFYQIFNQFTCF